MTVEIDMTLVGLLNPTGLFPSFGIPVFECNDDYYLSMVDGQKSTISAFTKASLHQYSLIPVSESVIVRTGDAAIYGFAQAANKYFIGDKSFLVKALREDIKKYRDTPFLLAEIGAFMGDATVQESANLLIEKSFNKNDNRVFYEVILPGEGRSEKYKESREPRNVRVTIYPSRTIHRTPKLGSSDS